MRVVRVTTALIVGLALLSATACNGGGGQAEPTPTPTPTLTVKPTMTPTPASPEEWYETTRARIKSAVMDYRAAHELEVPFTEGYTFLGSAPYKIIDICALVDGGFLPGVPQGCAAIEGKDNDNCDGGGCVCYNGSHYIWVANQWGNVYSTCEGVACNMTYATGFQQVWP
jgi:hypothetical protein